jgi:hypothetical protein
LTYCWIIIFVEIQTKTGHAWYRKVKNLKKWGISSVSAVPHFC